VTSVRPVVLVGLRAAGKGTVGRVLARLVGARFLDLDREIARLAAPRGAFRGRAGRLLETLGEGLFRDLEERALAGALGRDGTWVLAAGGGIVERAANRRQLAERARVVWLDVALDVLAARLLAPGEWRPPLVPGEDPRAELEVLDLRRREHFAALAEVHLELAAPVPTPEELARRIERALGEGEGVPGP